MAPCTRGFFLLPAASQLPTRNDMLMIWIGRPRRDALIRVHRSTVFLLRPGVSARYRFFVLSPLRLSASPALCTNPGLRAKDLSPLQPTASIPCTARTVCATIERQNTLRARNSLVLLAHGVTRFLGLPAHRIPARIVQHGP